MFRDAYQKGKFFTIFHSIGPKPLSQWQHQIRNGHCKQITDDDIRSNVFELISTNVTTCFLHAPIEPFKTLGIQLPCLTFIIKNLNKPFTFEIEIRDSENQLRRFQGSNFLIRSRFSMFIIQMPLRLDAGWNKVEFDLADFTRRAFATDYVETVRIRINANCRLRRIYFSDRLYAEDDKPEEYRLNGNGANKCNVNEIRAECSHVANAV